VDVKRLVGGTIHYPFHPFLAAIAAEQTAPITDVAPELTQASIGTLTYCTTAAIAVTAITTARRRKAVKMESTRG
jgi:hypothetical protein